jgi:hypothetical protein
LLMALEKSDAEFADLDGFVHGTPFLSRREDAFGDLVVRTRSWGKGYGERVRSSIWSADGGAGDTPGGWRYEWIKVPISFDAIF